MVGYVLKDFDVDGTCFIDNVEEEEAVNTALPEKVAEPSALPLTAIMQLMVIKDKIEDIANAKSRRKQEAAMRDIMNIVNRIFYDYGKCY